MMLLTFICIVLAGFSCYLASDKKKTQRKFTIFEFLSHNPFLCRSLAVVFYLVATYALCQEFQFSVGFISFWIFLSPILFIIILCINRLAQQK